MGAANIKDYDLLKIRELDNLRTVRRHKLPGAARRLAAGMRFKFVVPAIVINRFGPRLVRRLSIGKAAAAGAPDSLFFRWSSQPGMTIRPAWSRLRWNFRLITATAASSATAAPSLLTLSLLTLNGRLPLSLLRLRTLSAQQQGCGRYDDERQHDS